MLLDRFLGRAKFPLKGKDVGKTARRSVHPSIFFGVLRPLMPEKVFHNTYEVWFNIVQRRRRPA
jgi:hypothetical protein